VLAHELGRPSPGLSERAVTALAAHSWPGDAVELDALLVRTLLAAEADPLDAHDLCWHPEAAFGTDAASDRGGTRLDEPALKDEAPAELTASPPSTEEPPGSGAGAIEPTAEPTPVALALPSEALALELAHQIKNPLVVVKAFVRSVAELGDAPADLASLYEQTDEAIRRMDGAIEELLAFARLGPPRLGAVDVVEVLRESLREVWPEFASKDVAVTGPNGASLRVVGDAQHLRQAFGTLARHLLESIEARGTIAIAIDPRGEIRLRYRECGASTHLRGVAGLDPQSLPLAVLLVRGALAPGGGSLEVAQAEGLVEVALRFATG